MKNVILILTATVLFFASCKKENTPTPVTPKPVVADSLVKTKFLTSSIIPTTVGADSMTDVILKIRISITAGDSNVYLKRSVGNFGSDLQVTARSASAPHSPPVGSLSTESNVVMQSTGNLKINAGTTGVIAFTVIIHTRVRNGEYQLQLFNLPCSIGQDDGIFETNIALGSDCVTEWIPA